MERQDRDMPFLLKYENVAWYDGGKVRILDRRVFPEVRFVECATYQEVRQAVADMVTQSTGPYAAVGMGMVLAVRQSEHLGAGEREEFFTPGGGRTGTRQADHLQPLCAHHQQVRRGGHSGAGVWAGPGAGRI